MSQLCSHVNTYILTVITLPLLFQLAKRNEKVVPPPVCIKFYIQLPHSLVVIYSYAPSNCPPLRPLPGNYVTIR